MQAIEFTDRYGGKSPSWLRACLECEAMGCYPTGSGEDDQFVTCEYCGGTAKVSRWRTLLRLPRWCSKGLRFLWDTNVRRPEMHPQHWTRRDRWRMTVWAAYGAELGCKMPPVTPWPEAAD